MATCAIDDLAALIRCLQGAEEGPAEARFIRLRAELFAAAGELAGCFGPGTAELRVEQRDPGTPLVQPYPPEAPVEVRVVGSARPFTHGARALDYETTVTGTVPAAGAPLLRLEARPAGDGWSFAANFPAFPKYRGSDGASTTWKDSFFGDAALSRAVFRASSTEPGGVRIAADLDLSAGALEVLAQVLPQTRVAVEGTVRPRDAAFPLVALSGPIPDYSIERLAELSLELGTADAGGPDGKGESTLFVAGATQVGSMPRLRLRVPALQGGPSWVLEGSVDDPERYSLAAGLSALVQYAGGGQPLSLPAGLDMLGSLHLEAVTIGVAATRTPRINTVGFRVASAPGTRWTAPILGLTVSDFVVEWFVLSPFASPSLVGSVSGVLRLGEAADAPRLRTRVDLTGLDTAFAPDVAVSAELDPAYPIRIGQLFERFTGLELGLDLRVSEMMLGAETGPRTLRFTATLDGDWPLPVPLVRFERMQFVFLYGPNGYSGSVLAHVSLADFPFFAQADYRGTGKGWRFSGGLRPEGQPTNLQTLVNAVAGGRYPDLPANLGRIELRRLLLDFDTSTQEFGFDGVAGWPFDFPDLGLKLDIEAELSFKSRPAPAFLAASTAAATTTAVVVGDATAGRVYEGFVRGTLKVNDFAVSVIYSFDVEKNRTLTFAVRYRDLTLLCVLSKNQKQQTILRAGLSGVSFGDIVEYLVGLVDPQLGFRLPAPWDVLYQLRFDDL
ncbi:MAG TPA: hypothetical protein VHG51_12440, partial [Longimicrobiaceae bacterium]|nr:hypothetical protein [Longimicrobiaceae bacterium]